MSNLLQQVLMLKIKALLKLIETYMNLCQCIFKLYIYIEPVTVIIYFFFPSFEP